MEDTRVRFESLALPFMKSLYSAALRLTRQAEDASDVVQETYLRAYRTFANFQAGTNAKAWLFKIMYSVFVNQYHRKRREGESVELEQVEARFAAALATGPPSARQHLDNWGTAAHGPEVEEALQALPTEFRMVVLLIDVEEMSYEEAADALGCPVGTVRSRLSRARKMLFLGLKEYAEKLGYSESSKRSGA